MPDRLFVSEHVKGKRTAHVFKLLSEEGYVVFCFCCGQETETDLFDTQLAAEEWSIGWCEHTQELPNHEPASDSGGCGCQ